MFSCGLQEGRVQPYRHQRVSAAGQTGVLPANRRGDLDPRQQMAQTLAAALVGICVLELMLSPNSLSATN
jgi:hypothetical protein